MLKKHFCLFFMCCFISSSILFSQGNIWKNILENDIPEIDGIRDLIPNSAAYYDLTIRDLRQILQRAPSEQEVHPNNSSIIIPVPFPDGEVIQFKIVRYQMFEPELAAKYPKIQNYKGVAVDDPMTTVRFDWTARGFRAMIRKDGQQIFIDPYSRGTQQFYMSYFKRDYPNDDFECLFKGENIANDDPSSEKLAGECIFKGYRLSIATTAEYSNFFDATSAAQSDLVLAEVNTVVNRMNEVYERDLGIRLILIGNTDDLFYYNAGSDPFSNGDPGAMLNQNQSNTNSVIGSANYDVGHVFGTGGDSGLAGFGVVCNNSRKAEGATIRDNPTGDPFSIDYVAHEIGHQFRADHTQNNNCNRSSSSSYEPGSASTIMGYAGICSPNIQNNSDAYFHAISLQEMGNYVSGGSGGSSCYSTISTANTAPSVDDPGNFSIPKSTPFVLSTTAFDADGDTMTYCWEQWDPEFATMPPASTSTNGPLFRSLEPTTSPERYFINLPDLAAGVDPTWEELPSVARNMEFRVTVRDNNSNYGCTDEKNINVTVEDSDPFLVLQPNTNVNLSGGQIYNVQWDEAQTDQSPISCGTVDIFLSTDGGLSFSTLLLAATANDGAADVTIPSTPTTTARIMVKCATGIFFDISNTNFEITASVPDYTLSATPTEQTNCGANSVTYTINVGSIDGYTDPVTLSTADLPAGASGSFSPNPVIPGNSSTLTIDNLTAVADGSYNFDVTASSTSGNKSIDLDLNVVTPTPATLISPSDGATNQSITPTLTWAAESGVTSYDVQVATDAGFSNIVASTNVTITSWTVDPALNTLTTYFWRVRHIRTCGDDPWSSTFSFTTDDVIVAPCFQYDGGPYVDLEPLVCYPNCQTPTTAGFEVWANESYLLRGLTVGAEYTFEFCNGYDPNDWAANITVAAWDGSNATSNISTVSGCSVTFTATVTDVVVIIFDTCGNPELQVDNGFPTFRCTGNGPTLPDSCPALPAGCEIAEDFESGEPATGWTFLVTGSTAGTNWEFNANSFGSGTTNPGSGNWATYDDDDVGDNGQNNIATATSPTVDMSSYENIELAFDYAYDAFNNEVVFLTIADGATTYYWTGSLWTTTSTVWLSNSDASGNFSEAIPTVLNPASLSVTLEYNDQGEWAWGFGFDNFSLCGDEIDNPCPPTLAVDGDPMDNDEIDAGTYTAQNTITSTGTVNVGTTVTFEAGQSIILSPGFEALNGATFTARIQACTAANDPTVEERSEEIVLGSNEIKVFPNPFSDFTTIELDLVEESDVSLLLYDITGKQIATILQTTVQTAGVHQYLLDANAIETGIYILMINIDGKLQSKKLSIVR